MAEWTFLSPDEVDRATKSPLLHSAATPLARLSPASALRYLPVLAARNQISHQHLVPPSSIVTDAQLCVDRSQRGNLQAE